MKKFIKRILLLATLLLANLITHAAEINFLANPEWASVLKKAKQEKKIIFFDAYATWCGPCKQMDADVYSNDEVAKFYNNNFINVKYDMEAGEGLVLAQKYAVRAYPTLLFIDEDGKLLHKGMGFKEKDKFIELGKDAISPEKQFTAISKNSPNLSPEKFIEYGMAAVDFGDVDYNENVKSFLINQKDILGSNSLIRIIMEGTTFLPDENSLAYLVANKEKINQSGLYTPEQTKSKINKLALVYAVYSNTDNEEGSVDLESVRTLLEKYIPEDAYFTYNYFKTQYFLEEEDEVHAKQTLKEMIEASSEKIKFENLCDALMNALPQFKAADVEEIFTKFDGYKIPDLEASKAYIKDVVKIVVYIKLENKDKAKLYAQKLMADPQVPEQIKTQAQQVLSKFN